MEYDSSRCVPYTGALSYGTSVKSVVDDVLEVLAHAHLAHEAVLVAVHAGELTDVGEDVVKTVRKLESVDVAEAVLKMSQEKSARNS